MRPLGRRVLCGTALALVAAAGCQAPAPPAAAPPTATPSAPAPTVPVPSPAGPPELTPRTVSVTLPTEVLPVDVLGVSGRHLLVQGDATYRVSHDSGATWEDAAFPCAQPDGCDEASSRIGRASGGVLLTYSAQVGRLDAYSLVANAIVGAPYLPAGRTVVDMTGGLVLLQDSGTGAYTVHSLLDGSDRAVALGPDATNPLVLDDGSVLAATTGAGTTWERVAPDGSRTVVFHSGSGTGDVLVSGNLAAFRVGRGARQPPRHCVVDVTAPATGACRDGIPGDRQYALGSSGLVVTRLAPHPADRPIQHLFWLRYSDGTLRRPAEFASVTAWNFDRPYGVTGAAPVVATHTADATYLLRPRGAGAARVRLDWARRPTYPHELALGTSTILGAVDTPGHGLTWTRSLDDGRIGPQRRLGPDGQVAADGTLAALAEADTGRLRFYRSLEPVATARAPEGGAGYSMSGGHLLLRPGCRVLPPSEDDDCESSAALWDATGRSVATPRFTEDLWGDLRVARGGDGSIRSRVLTVSAIAATAGSTTWTVELPEPGEDGYYTGVRLAGDWVGATAHRAGGGPRPVLADYRGSAVKVGTADAVLLGIGDGLAVSRLPGGTLQVWDLATDTTWTVAASSDVVAVAGTRLAYLAGGDLVVADFAP